MGLIKQLKQFITGVNIFPITKTNAVYDDTVGRLDTLLQSMIVEGDSLERSVVSEEVQIDADRLGGQLPEYYAKAEEVIKKSDIVDSFDSTDPNKAFSANKGRELNDKFEELSEQLGGLTLYIMSESKFETIEEDTESGFYILYEEEVVSND